MAAEYCAELTCTLGSRLICTQQGMFSLANHPPSLGQIAGKDPAATSGSLRIGPPSVSRGSTSGSCRDISACHVRITEVEQESLI